MRTIPVRTLLVSMMLALTDVSVLLAHQSSCGPVTSVTCNMCDDPNIYPACSGCSSPSESWDPCTECLSYLIAN